MKLFGQRTCLIIFSFSDFGSYTSFCDKQFLLHNFLYPFLFISLLIFLFRKETLDLVFCLKMIPLFILHPGRKEESRTRDSFLKEVRSTSEEGRGMYWSKNLVNNKKHQKKLYYLKKYLPFFFLFFANQEISSQQPGTSFSNIWKYIFIETFHHEQEVAQGQFLRGIQLVLNTDVSFF